MLKSSLYSLLAFLFVIGYQPPASADSIYREGASFNRSSLEWGKSLKPEERNAPGAYVHALGWVEYDIDISEGSWYALWLKGMPHDWGREVYIDGEPVLWLSTSTKDDADPDPKRKGWTKEANLYFPKGRHALRIRRLGYPAALPLALELKPAAGDASAGLRVTKLLHNVVRVGEKIAITIQGGVERDTSYGLVLRDDVTGELTKVGRVEFPAAARLVERSVEIVFPKQGAFHLIPEINGKLSRPADLKAGQFVAVDVHNAPVPAAVLKTTPLLDIDCASAVPKDGFWEKDGKTRVVSKPFGNYRKSSGAGCDPEWGTDGFSYRFEVPEIDHLYRLRVTYPDDERRSMGFWINDAAVKQSNSLGIVNTGGVETGDHYRLTNRMQVHEAFSFPRNTKGLVVAVINLVPGMKAAAARIQIDRVDSSLPAAALGETRGRAMGFYFEEPGRWLKFFGGLSGDISEHLKTMERWGQWNRYLGANVMFPTINVYQSNHYPSHILDGYFSTPVDQVRMAALVAEQYQCRLIPEFNLSGQWWFDKHVMGVWTEKHGEGHSKVTEVKFASPETRETVLQDFEGNYKCGWEPFVYNPLHPKVQEMYVNIFGELADLLGDCKSFDGLSSRLMLSWVFQGWNALPGLKWGYDDWSVEQFSKETGIAVPGAAGDPARFTQRFQFLTGPSRQQWMDWRCAKLFAFHQRLLKRIQRAKPSAKLYFTYFGQDLRHVFAARIPDQMKEFGLDLARYEREPGMVIIPGVSWGRRFSTPIGDAITHGKLYSADFNDLLLHGGRAVGLYSSYYEVNRHLDWTRLGGIKNSAFDACAPSGVNERELFALAMADGDCRFVIAGGSGWIFGTPEVMQPFLREYRALPDEPFHRFEKAVDPVAVWQRKEPDGTLWFYLVNRLPVDVSARVRLLATEVVPAAGGEKVAMKNGVARIALPPFMMRSFRAVEGTLCDCQAETPSEESERLQTQVEAAKGLDDDIASRRVWPEATKEQASAAMERIDEALQSYREGAFWKAHRMLESPEVVMAEYQSGRFLPGVWERSLPHGVPNFSDRVVLGTRVILNGAPGCATAATSVSYDTHGHLWVGTPEGVAEYDPTGKWLRTVPLFDAPDLDLGDIRRQTLLTPRPYLSEQLFAAGGQSLVAQQGKAISVFDKKSGRAVRLTMGNSFSAPGSSRLIGGLPDGSAMIVTGSGVYLYGPDGTMQRKVSATIAQAGAADEAGRVYLATKTGIEAASSGGSEFLPEAGVKRLCVSADGSLLVACVVKGKPMLVEYRRTGAGKFLRQWTQSAPDAFAGFCISPRRGLTIALGRPDGHEVVQEYEITENGLKNPRGLVAAAEETASLNGWTPLKVHDSRLYFISGGKLMRLEPAAPGGLETAVVAFDPHFKSDHPEFEAFAFAPNGDLYLASFRNGSAQGANLYLCRKNGAGWAGPEYLNGSKPLAAGGGALLSDLGVDPQGGLILRMKTLVIDGAQEVGLFRWAPGNKPECFLDMGKLDAAGVEYGLCQTPDGGWLVGGGQTRSVWRLSAAGTPVWETRRLNSCPPGYVDMCCPAAVALDHKGRTWAVDPVRSQVLCFDGNGKLVNAQGSFGDGRDLERLTLDRPSGIATLQDSQGNEWLYIADSGNRRMLKWKL